MYNGQSLIYIGLKGEEIPLQVQSFRHAPVLEATTVGIVGPKLDKLFGLVRTELKEIAEGTELVVLGGDPLAKRGTFTVARSLDTSQGLVIEAAGALPAGTREGDTVQILRVVHNHPLVTGTIPGEIPGAVKTLTDLVHQSHPAKDENNPGQPRIVLHAWKYPNEEHEVAAEDHPLYDQPFEPKQARRDGTFADKARPKHEAAVAEQQARAGIEPQIRRGLDPQHDNGELPKGNAFVSGLPNPLEHHPGNPETVHYKTRCLLCQGEILRTAHHQGGQEFNPEPVEGAFVKHATTCKGIPPEPPKPEAPVKAEEPALPASPLAGLEGALTLENLAKHLPVVEVLFDGSDIRSYAGVKATLPSGHSHTVKTNGMALDFADALQFVHANGFTTHVQHPSVEAFKQAVVQATELPPPAMFGGATAAEECAEQKPEPGVLKQMEEDLKNAPPAIDPPAADGA